MQIPEIHFARNLREIRSCKSYVLTNLRGRGGVLTKSLTCQQGSKTGRWLCLAACGVDKLTMDSKGRVEVLQSGRVRRHVVSGSEPANRPDWLTQVLKKNADNLTSLSPRNREMPCFAAISARNIFLGASSALNDSPVLYADLFNLIRQTG